MQSRARGRIVGPHGMSMAGRYASAADIRFPTEPICRKAPFWCPGRCGVARTCAGARCPGRSGARCPGDAAWRGPARARGARGDRARGTRGDAAWRGGVARDLRGREVPGEIGREVPGRCSLARTCAAARRSDARMRDHRRRPGRDGQPPWRRGVRRAPPNGRRGRGERRGPPASPAARGWLSSCCDPRPDGRPCRGDSTTHGLVVAVPAAL